MREPQIAPPVERTIAEIAKTPSVIIPRAMVDGGYVANRVLGEGTPEQQVYDFEFYDKLRPKQ